MGTEHIPGTPRVVEHDPAGLGLMVRAALPVVPVLNRLPGVRKTGAELPDDLVLTRHDVSVDRTRLAEYSEVCGFPVKEDLPLTYPHLLAFGLHMAIMTDASFPFPAVGTVHLENRITRHREIGAGEPLQVTARPEALRPHPKGLVFDLRTQVHSAGEPVWEETSTFLRRGKGEAEAPAGGMGLETVPPSGVVWKLDGDLGRRYAAVSGDHNPIHLYRLTAKAFGFPRQIAHGMWSLARCLAALEGRLPAAVTVETAFKKPVLLPGRVAFGSHPEGAGYAFSLTDPGSGAPHLVGRCSPEPVAA
jgi:acyl dehydratase